MSDKKLAAAKKAVEYVKDGMVLGLGTGSTTRYAVEEIGKLVKDGYDLVGIPTSKETEKQAASLGIKLSTLEKVDLIDLTIDGADEVDPQFRLIKGLGGALLREKMVASYSEQEIIIVDESKMVDRLGTKTPVPVEVVQFGHLRTKRTLEMLGCSATIRGGASPFITDNGNLIYDCKFPGIDEPMELDERFKDISGVVENGLFLDLTSRVVVGTDRGTIVKEKD